jgi:hypothetical protein
VRVVEEIIRAWPQETLVFDPFSGTATTSLCAAYAGHAAVAMELNPFLVWLGRAKTDLYSDSDIAHAQQGAEDLLELIGKPGSPPYEPPRIHNIERWWGQAELDFLCALMGGLGHIMPRPNRARTLLLIAFCRFMIRVSNAAFNHQSMSFKSDAGTSDAQMVLFSGTTGLSDLFREDASLILTSARENPPLKATIIEGDSRLVTQYLDTSFDLLVTSPPYPNRMSYIRELRPYMYWLGYLGSAREAGELDWQAIGGTWGIATSRLQEWKRSPDGFYPRYFVEILESIAHADNKSGRLLSNYVAKYFEDMWKHFQGATELTARGGEIHYIVGNSVFYGICLPVERLFSDMFRELGLTDVSIRVLRKRNSKKELLEFDVSGRKL